MFGQSHATEKYTKGKNKRKRYIFYLDPRVVGKYYFRHRSIIFLGNDHSWGFSAICVNLVLCDTSIHVSNEHLAQQEANY